MKKIIFCLLISLVLNAYFLPKYKSVKTNDQSGIVYLNAAEFEYNKNIYIQTNAHNSYLNKYIYYDFSDDVNFSSPSRLLKPASTWSSSTSVNNVVTSFTDKCCFEILKDSSKKYLFIQFSGYSKYGAMTDDYLEIENTKINWGKFWLYFIIIIFIVVFGLGILIFAGCFLYHVVIKKKCRKQEITPLNQNQSGYNNPDSKVGLYPDYNNYNNNNGYNNPQQQNMYYDPTKSAVDNNYGYYSGSKIN